MNSIGNRLFELRKNKGITQEKLAEQLNVSRQSISNWELDKALPDMDKMMVLASLYEVSLDYIAYGTKEAAEQDETAVPNLQNSDTKANPWINRALTLALALCVVMLIPVLVLFIGIISHLPGDTSKMNSNIVSIDRVVEQYSLVEVAMIDNQGHYSKDRVWIDTRGITDDDYIFTYTKSENSSDMKFEYYSRTMFIPFVGIVLLLSVSILIIFSMIKMSEKASK